MKNFLRATFSGKAFFLAACILWVSGNVASAQTLTALSGSTVGSNQGETYVQLVDGEIGTKWGQHFDVNNKPWTIFKSSEAVVPTDYFLITGNDSGINQGRNWSRWKIYGANFASDEEATRDAKEWVLIDQKSRAGLPNANYAAVTYTFSEAPTEKYQYFRIEIEDLDNLNPTYMQMSEFGFGDPSQLKSIAYSFIWSTENTSADPGSKLIDLRTSKWGFDSGNHAGVVIFRSTKILQPTFYTLMTSVDANNPGRNWKDYTLYGGNFESESAARADYEAHKGDRNFEGFKVLEKREGVGPDVLPDISLYEAYITMQTPAPEPCEYFMVIVDKAYGGGLCQMSEFVWGDATVFAQKIEENYEKYADIDKTVLAWQALYDEYDKLLGEIKTAEGPSALNAVKVQLEGLKKKISASNVDYVNYVNMAKLIMREVDNESFTDESVGAQMKTYMTEDIAPDETFPIGSYLYILNRRQANGEQLAEVCLRLSAILDKFGHQEEAIEVTYEPLSGTAGFKGAEDYPSLIDGDDNTKWCHMHSNGLSYIIFKTSDPIVPTMIRLFTSGDTGSNAGRNWKKWKIFGANFEYDDEAVREAEGWAMIDDQGNAGLPAESNKAVFRNLSNPSVESYRYFKVEIYESAGADRMQMSELTFMNQGNFRKLRSDYAEEFRSTYETIQDENYRAEQALIEAFISNYKAMETVSNITDLGTLYNQLKSGEKALEESHAKYEELANAMDVMTNYSFDHPDDQDFFDKYLNEELSSEEFAPYGTLSYILTHGNLNKDQMNLVISHLNNTMKAMDEGLPVALGGTSTWNSGAYIQLFDGKAETKWGCELGNEAYCIVKFLDEVPAVPYFYKLQTGWDTDMYGARNWKNWKIYGGNFANDFEATRNAREGWVLIEDKENVDQRRLPARNGVWAPFGFAHAENIPEEGFRYYMVVVTKTGGNQQQMSQLVFGMEEDFADVRAEYVNELTDKNVDAVVADTAVINKFLAAVDSVQDSEGIEEMFLAYYAGLEAWERVKASALNYDRYRAAAESVEQFLKYNPLTESEALTFLTDYLNGNAEPDENGYPNGSKMYILTNHEVNDSTVLAEIDYMEELKAAAVRVGYVAGTEITPLLVNPTFARGSEGWGGTGVTSYGTYGNAEKGFSSAAECVRMQKLDLSQTLTGLKNGLYLLEMNAGYRASGDIESYNHVAYIYANDNIIPVCTTREGMIAKDDAVDGDNCSFTSEKQIINKESSIENDVLGYVIWGVEGGAIAFRAGRYANAVVTKVTDGTLKVGICNPFSSAPNDQECTTFGNTRLTYLGEMDDKADMKGLDEALLRCAERATTMADVYEAIADVNYAKAPNFSIAERETLRGLRADTASVATAQEKYELITKFSEAFRSVAQTKLAYVQYFKNNMTVFDHWSSQVTYMPSEGLERFDKDVMGGQTKWLDGVYSADEAVAESELLLVKYPDYLSEVNNGGILPCPGNMEQTDAFTYAFHLADEATMVALRGMYDGLKDDEIVLSFEYKGDFADLKTYAYFNNPEVSRGRCLLLEDMESTNEWRTVYYNVSHARLGNFVEGGVKSPWGHDKGHGIGFEFEGGNGKTVSIRNVHMTTLKAVEDAGATVGVGQVVEHEGPLQQRGIYTVSGVRVRKAVKGLNIIDGKKVMVND